jgi:mannosyl-3-phosphoglycerate phosphatase
MQVVFTDLDGTLLDRNSYDCRPALPALERLRREGVPVVFVTSKTRAETEYWRARLHNSDPFVVENGGAAIIPAGSIAGAPERLEFGDRYADLLAALDGASAASGCRVRGFHSMSAAEIAKRCGLSPDLAELARRREYDEAFEILDPERAPALLAAIESHGKRWTRGGRFHHILGAHDKGTAVRALLAFYRQAHPEVRSFGFGDAPNDAPFLAAVDRPSVVRSPKAWGDAVFRRVLGPRSHR